MVNRNSQMPQPPAHWGDDFDGEMTQDQFDPPAGVIPNTQEDKGMAQGGILSGWSPPDWRPEDSGLHLLFTPEEIKDMDLGGAGADALPDPLPGQDQGGDGSDSVGTHTIVPREPVLPENQPGDID